MEKKLNTGELEIGMYVSRVDRPWLDTPFMFQGFRIRTDHDIETLDRYCDHVFIDESKVDDQPANEPLLTFGTLPLTEEMKAIPGLPKRRVAYEDTAPIEKEMSRARDTKHALGLVVENLIGDIQVEEDRRQHHGYRRR